MFDGIQTFQACLSQQGRRRHHPIEMLWNNLLSLWVGCKAFGRMKHHFCDIWSGPISTWALFLFFLLSLNHIPDGRWCPPQLGRKPLVNKTNKTQTATIKLDVLVIATQARTRAGVGMVLSSLLCWHCEALASSLHRLDPSVEVRLVDLMEPPYAAGAREEIASIGSSIWQNCNHL